MLTVILAGGLGTRLSEETMNRPKPMVEIGGYPLLWHVLHIYSAHGFDDFIVACGYRGDVIKRYFQDFLLHNSDLEIDLRSGTHTLVNSSVPNWRVRVVDTGRDTMTAGRLLRLRCYLERGTFMVTYGDGVADVDLKALVAFHKSHGKLATVTAVAPPARFGSLRVMDGRVTEFTEKPPDEGLINGGFFVFEPGVLDYMVGDEMPLEREPLERLAQDGQLMAFRHRGFWHAMDTVRDRNQLEALWSSGKAPWKVWE